MRYRLVAFAALLLVTVPACSQTLDPSIDVGDYHLHFHILKGTAMPILFEGGAGADATVWNGILKPIADITHATLITYDRAGFGTSTQDTSNHDLEKHSLLQGIQGLETALKKLAMMGT
jgi:hypothetical protein